MSSALVVGINEIDAILEEEGITEWGTLPQLGKIRAIKRAERRIDSLKYNRNIGVVKQNIPLANATQLASIFKVAIALEANYLANYGNSSGEYAYNNGIASSSTVGISEKYNINHVKDNGVSLEVYEILKGLLARTVRTV